MPWVHHRPSGSWTSHFKTQVGRAATIGPLLVSVAEEKRARWLSHWLVKLLPGITHSTSSHRHWSKWVKHSPRPSGAGQRQSYPVPKRTGNIWWATPNDYHAIRSVPDATLGLALCWYWAETWIPDAELSNMMRACDCQALELWLVQI